MKMSDLQAIVTRVRLLRPELVAQEASNRLKISGRLFHEFSLLQTPALEFERRKQVRLGIRRQRHLAVHCKYLVPELTEVNFVTLNLDTDATGCISLPWGGCRSTFKWNVHPDAVLKLLYLLQSITIIDLDHPPEELLSLLPVMEHENGGMTWDLGPAYRTGTRVWAIQWNHRVKYKPAVRRR